MATQVAVAQPPYRAVNKQLYALQQIKRMRGGSQAHLMRASDGGFYVVKFTNNGQHIRVLANEYLASRIGQRLALPTPRVEVIAVSSWLVEHTADLRFEYVSRTEPCSSGLQLGSRYAADIENDFVYEYLPESMFPKVRNASAFAGILVLDKWTCNADGRQAVFSKRARSAGWDVTFVDQGYCFNAGKWNFPDRALHGVYYRNHVYQHVTSWDAFEPALTRAEEMDICELWQCAEGIPPEWCGDEPEALPRLIEDLHQRRSKIRDLITGFRKSSRSPFPYWADNGRRRRPSPPHPIADSPPLD